MSTTTPLPPQTWPEGQEPTPEQFAEWLEGMTREHLEDLAITIIQDRRMAAACFIANHASAVEEARALRELDRVESWRAPHGDIAEVPVYRRGGGTVEISHEIFASMLTSLGFTRVEAEA